MRLNQTRLSIGETRLLIKSDLEEIREPARRAIVTARAQLLSHIERYPEFRWSIEPLDPPQISMPGFIVEMYNAGQVAGVGPFASVAGVLAGVAARAIAREGAEEIMVENGGDLCLHGDGPFVVAVFASSSVFSGKLALDVRPRDCFAGLCTSSASVGESMSLGEADAVVAYDSDSPAIADAVATAVCNEVRGPDGVQKGIELAKKIGRCGVLIIRAQDLGASGPLPELLEIESDEADLVLDPRLHSRA